MSYIIVNPQAFEFLNYLKQRYPHHTSLINDIEGSLNLRLWHELSDHLLELTSKEELQSSNDLIQLYNSLIVSVEKGLNPLKLVVLIHNVLRNFHTNWNEALIFLDELESRMDLKGEEMLYIQALKVNALYFLNCRVIVIWKLEDFMTVKMLLRTLRTNWINILKLTL